MTTVTTLEQFFPAVAENLLAATVSVLGTDAPATQMIILGPAVAPAPNDDGTCGQLTVQWGPAFPSKQPLTRDTTGDQHCQVITMVQLVQTLFVCAPTMNDQGEIDPAAITTAALDLTRIASKWWFGLLALGAAGIFVDLPNVPCRAINWGQLAPGSNQGGVQALNWTLTLSIS